jgi:hypothetical protein
MPFTSPDLRTVNSTTYADVAGLPFGLERLPGEDSHAFIDRLYSAVSSRRDHSFQGTVNEIALQLGLRVRTGITVSSTDPSAVISCSVQGVRLVSGATDVTYPLLTIEEDGLWKWRLLSDLVSDIDTTSGFTATLTIADGPALQLVRQGNVNTVINEQIEGNRDQLARAGIISGSERFNKAVPSYTLSSSGLLIFSTEPAADLTISYQYLTMPYEMVCSEVGVLGLLDPNLNQAAVTGGGVLAYQVREALQEIMEEDPSYWAR